MSKENFSELLAKSDEDARVAKISRDDVEEYIQKRLKDKLRIGSSIIDKKAGKRIYYTEDAANIIGKSFHWLAARSFAIEKITDRFVVVDAKDAWGRSMGQFTIFLADLNLSTWDFAVTVRTSIADLKALKKAEAKRNQEQDLKKLRDQVKAAQRALELAEKAVEAREAVSTK